MRITNEDNLRVEFGRQAFRILLDRSRGELFEGFQAQAGEAFNLVAHPANWKDPIDREVSCSPERLGFVLEAVKFFTASVPTFEKVGRDRFRVKAAGYYAAVGA